MYNRKETVNDILLQLGFSPVLKGFRSIPEAVDILMENPGISMIDLYKEVGEKSDENPKCVERAIRYAIETAMQEFDMHMYRRIMGQFPPSGKAKPTNGRFLILLTLKIKKMEERNEKD